MAPHRWLAVWTCSFLTVAACGRDAHDPGAVAEPETTPEAGPCCPLDPASLAYRVRDIDRGAFSSTPNAFVPGSGRVFFVADDGRSGRELWVSDGTTAGTALVADTDADVNSSGPARLGTVGDAVFFRAAGVDWRSDGTAAGTIPLTGCDEGPVAPFTVVGRSAYYVCDYAVWRSDGTPGGTRTLLPTRGHSIRNLFVFREALWFLTTDPFALWTTDGSDAGTRVAEAGPPFSTRGIADLLGIYQDGASLYFWLRRGELWARPHDAAAATLVASFPGEELTLTAGGGGRFYFGVGPWFYPRALWASDGTAAGTARLRDFEPTDSSLKTGTVVGGRLFFLAADGIHGTELWTSDATVDGTRLVRDIRPGTQGGLWDVHDLDRLGERIVFVANDGIHGREPWISDGTEEGTRLVKDVAPGAPGGAGWARFTPLCERLFFLANDGLHGWELWQSDGSEAGTTLVHDIRPGTSGSGIDDWELVAVGPRLFFAADDGTSGSELWTYGPPQPATPPEPEPTPPPGPNHAPTLTGKVSQYGSVSYQVCFTPVDPDGDDVRWTLTFDDGSPSSARTGLIHSGRQRCEVYRNECACWVSATVTAEDGRGGTAAPLILRFYSL